MSVLVDDIFAPSEDEVRIAEVSSRRLADLKDQVNIRLVGDTVEPIAVPASAVRFLTRLLAAMARGDAVTLIPVHAELTTKQAADLLGVSRPFLIGLLDQGEMEHRRVGTHRRIPLKSILAYKHRFESNRRKALDELVALGQEVNRDY